MKIEIVKTLTINFEEKVHKTSEGIEYWYARDLQKLLGYSDWRNFEKIVKKSSRITQECRCIN